MNWKIFFGGNFVGGSFFVSNWCTGELGLFFLEGVNCLVRDVMISIFP